jgi:hypothetical protein
MMMTSLRFKFLSVCLLLLVSSVIFGASKVIDGGLGTDSAVIKRVDVCSLLRKNKDVLFWTI